LLFRSRNIKTISGARQRWIVGGNPDGGFVDHGHARHALEPHDGASGNGYPRGPLVLRHLERKASGPVFSPGHVVVCPLDLRHIGALLADPSSLKK
jgi:hypothetical protein